jgi:hypothetical protein
MPAHPNITKIIYLFTSFHGGMRGDGQETQKGEETKVQEKTGEVSFHHTRAFTESTAHTSIEPRARASVGSEFIGIIALAVDLK